MAKSNYLPRILLAGVICICGCVGSDNLVVGCRLLVVSNRLVQKEIDAPNGKQKDESPKPIAQGSLQKRYQVSGIRYQEGVGLGAKSSFPTTNNQQPDSYRVTTKKIYDSQIGIREQGINTGPQVEKYLNYVNLKKGQPWCAAFICWVYGQAGIENPHSGWSPDLFKGSKVIWDRAESRKLKVKSLTGEPGTKSQYPIAIGSRHSRIAYIYPPSQTTGNRQQTTPKTGDIFGLFFPDKNRIAHAGFIDQWDGTWLITVEGNTNVSGGREGDGVYRKRRLVKSVYQVARYL